MSETIDKLVKDAGDALLAAVWQEANTFGEHTAEVLDIILNSPESPNASMEKIMELTGKDKVSVMMGSLQHATHVIEREHAAAEYVKARRLQANVEAEQAQPGVDWDKSMNSWAGQEHQPEEAEEPTFAEKVKAERERQIGELGYDAEHDDAKGLTHLTLIRDSYVFDPVKRAAMDQAISDWHDRNTSMDGPLVED